MADMTFQWPKGDHQKRTGRVHARCERAAVLREQHTRPGDELTADVVTPRVLWQAAALTVRWVIGEGRKGNAT
jgi:hypothetical protein